MQHCPLQSIAFIRQQDGNRTALRLQQHTGFFFRLLQYFAAFDAPHINVMQMALAHRLQAELVILRRIFQLQRQIFLPHTLVFAADKAYFHHALFRYRQQQQAKMLFVLRSIIIVTVAVTVEIHKLLLTEQRLHILQPAAIYIKKLYPLIRQQAFQPATLQCCQRHRRCMPQRRSHILLQQRPASVLQRLGNGQAAVSKGLLPHQQLQAVLRQLFFLRLPQNGAHNIKIGAVYFVKKAVIFRHPLAPPADNRLPSAPDHHKKCALFPRCYS